MLQSRVISEVYFTTIIIDVLIVLSCDCPHCHLCRLFPMYAPSWFASGETTFHLESDTMSHGNILAAISD